jgi:hypothetical protein
LLKTFWSWENFVCIRNIVESTTAVTHKEKKEVEKAKRMLGVLKPGGIKVAARDDKFKGDESKRVPQDWNTRGWMWTVMSWKDKNERYR